MQRELGVLGEPGVHVVVLVGAIVVDDQVEVEPWGKLAIERTKELQELLVAVTRQALADDTTVEHAQRGEQRRGAVALVVVGHRAGAPRLHRQRGLGAIQRLDLALLIDAQDDRALRRVQT